MPLSKEGLKATFRRLRQYPVGVMQIHGRRVAIGAPDLADVFLDELKGREAIALQEIKNIEYMRAAFLAEHRARTKARLKLKYGR